MPIKVTDFRSFTRNTLRGFLTVRLTDVGLEIRDLALHQRSGKRWLQLPAKPFDKPDGTKGWNYILAFYEKRRFKEFQEMALKAFDTFQRETRRNEGWQSSPI